MINLKTFLKTLFEKYKRIVQELKGGPITIGNRHYSRIRVIGNGVDSTAEPRKNNYNYFL